MGSAALLPAAHANKPFSAAWMHAVGVASTAIHVMECELMLEYAVKSAWMRPTGNKLMGPKLMGCLGSRQNALRSATLGQVAVRLWCFDQTVRYDKMEVEVARNEEEEEEEEGGAVGNHLKKVVGGAKGGKAKSKNKSSSRSGKRRR
jgi:hypothetical protein